MIEFIVIDLIKTKLTPSLRYLNTNFTHNEVNNMKVWNAFPKKNEWDYSSARKLGKLSDLDHVTIQKVADGETLPNHKTIIKISKGFNRKAEEVFDFTWEDKEL